MATKPKAAAPSKDEDGGGKDPSAQASPKKGLVGSLLGILGLLNPFAILKLPMMMKLVVGGALLVAILGGGGAYYFLSAAPKEASEAAEGEKTTAPTPPPAQTAVFFDVPDIIVNLQTPDATQAFLKLSVALELDKLENKQAIEPVLPRVIDQFQTYLRELRVEDIRGAVGVMRLKEELLRRVNIAVAPTPVRDVLLKEMIVQ